MTAYSASQRTVLGAPIDCKGLGTTHEVVIGPDVSNLKIVFHNRHQTDRRQSRVCRYSFSLDAKSGVVGADILLELRHPLEVEQGDALPNTTLIVKNNGTVLRTIEWGERNVTLFHLTLTENLIVEMIADNATAQTMNNGLYLGLTAIVIPSSGGRRSDINQSILLRPLEFLCGIRSPENCSLLADLAARFNITTQDMNSNDDQILPGCLSNDSLQFLQTLGDRRGCNAVRPGNHSSPTVLLLLIDGTVSYTAVLNCAMGPQVLIDLQRKGDALQLKTEKCPASDPEKEDGVKDKQAKTKELLAIGLGVGVALLLLIIGGLFCLYMYRRCRNRNQENGKVEGQGLQDLQAAKKNLLSSNSSG